MIEVKEAIQKAVEFAEQIYGGKPADVRVEEVDSTDDIWLITLSFEVLARAPGLPIPVPSARLDLMVHERQYKIFQVNKSDGRVQSMKIRQVG